MKVIFNDIALFAIPQTRRWAVMFFVSLLFGVIFFDIIAPTFLKMFSTAFTLTEGKSIHGTHPVLLGVMIFLKNSLVALICILTARLTIGIYPAIVVLFNGLLIGFVATALTVHGGMQVWQFAAGLAPHIGFELFGIFLACAIGFLKIPMKIKLQSSSLVWVSLLLAASLESTVSNMITAGF